MDMDRFKDFNPFTSLLVLLLLITFIGSIAAGASITFYLVILLIALGLMCLSIWRNRILFKIGVRNIVRRKGYALIVIFGLIIGTVIISSSLIVGDTMDNMVTDLNYRIYGETDEIIYGVDMDGSLTYISEEEYETMRFDLLEIENVEDVTAGIQEDVAVINVDKGQTEPSFRLMGYDTTSDPFGHFVVGGSEQPFDIGPDEVYVDEDSAEALDASDGCIRWRQPAHPDHNGTAPIHDKVHHRQYRSS